MGDPNRIEQLAEKLQSPVFEIRLRAAKNLLSKSQAGILSGTSLSSSSIAVTLAAGISACLNIASGNVAEDSTLNFEVVDTLAQLLRNICKSKSSQTLAADIFADVLDRLYVMSSHEGITSSTRDHIEEAINSLCSLNAVGQVGADDILLSQPFQRSALKQEITKVDVDTNPSTSPYSTIPFEPASCRPASSSSGSVAPKGAGAILLSSLVQTGWKFPPFILTESDERFLFDLEVKIKLGHRSAGPLLWDVLEDFPVHALLQRPGLIHALLDVLGSTVIDSYTEDTGDDNSAAGPSAMTVCPLVAVRWFEALIKKGTEAFQTQLDGGLCSRVPKSLASLPVKSPADGDDGKTVLAAFADDDAVKMPTLADQLAKTMYASRHPVLLSADSSSSDHNPPIAAAAAVGMSSLAVLPPSLPGLSFAVCTAALPLLQSRDVALARAVLSLTETALPFIFEPSSILVRSGTSTSVRPPAAPLREVDKSRLQHLLNRVEQLLNFFGESIPSIETLSFANFEKLSSSEGGGDGENLLIDDIDDAVDLKSIALDAVIVKVFMTYMSIVPPSMVQDVSASSGHDGEKAMYLGQRTLSLLERLCSAWQSDSQSLIVQTHGHPAYGQQHSLAEEALSPLRFLLTAADSAASRALFTASEIIDSALAVRDLTLGRPNVNEGEYVPSVGTLLHRGGIDTIRCALDNALTAVRLADRQTSSEAASVLDFGIGYSAAVLVIASVVVQIVEKSREAADMKADAVSLFCSLFSNCDDGCRQRMLACLLEVAAVARPSNPRIIDALTAVEDPLAHAVVRANFGFVRIPGTNEGAAAATGSVGVGISNLWIDGDNRSYAKAVAPIDILAGIVDSLAEPVPLRLLLAFGSLGGASDESADKADAELTKMLSVALLDIICDRRNSIAVMAAGRAAVKGQRSKSPAASEASKAVESDYAPLLLLFKTLEWTHTSDDALPRPIASFIQRLEDHCAASAPEDIQTADAYGRSLALGLFHGSQAVRARCALRLRHELAGLTAPSEAIFEDSAASAVANSYDPFPPEALVHLYGYADREIARGITAGVDEPELDESVLGAGFTHTDVRKLVDIAFGGKDVPRSQIVRDEGLRASALKQLRGILKGDSGLLATADLGWVVDLSRKCCAAIADVKHESLVNGSKTASEIAVSVTGSIAIEAAATLKTLISRLPSLRAAASFRSGDLSETHSAEKSSTTESDAERFSCRALLSILLHSKGEGSVGSTADVGVNPRIEALRLLAAQTLLLILLDATPLLLNSDSSRIPLIRTQALQSSAAARFHSNPGHARLPLFMLNHFGLAKLSDDAVAAEVSSSLGVTLPSRTSTLLQMHSEGDFVAVSVRGSSGSSTCMSPSGTRSKLESPLPPFSFLVQVYRGAVAPPRHRVLSSLARWTVAQIARALEHATRREKGHTHAHLRDILSSCRCLERAFSGFWEILTDFGVSDVLKAFLQMQHNSIDELLSLEVALQLLAECVASSLSHGVTQMSTPVQVQLADCIEILSTSLMRYMKSPPEDFVNRGKSFLTEHDRQIEVQTQHAVQAVQEVCLSLWCACVSTNGPLPTTPLLATSSSLLSHPLPTVLASLLSSELWSAASRSHAAIVLEKLVRWHGAVDSLQQVSSATMQQSSHSRPSDLFYSTSSYGDSSELGLRSSALDAIKCAAKLLRPPDGMRCGAALQGCLRILLLVLMSPATSNMSETSALQTQDLRWLVRLSYDRRASIRVLSLEILGVFARMHPTTFECLSYGDDSRSEEESSPLDGPSEVSSHLRHIFMDTTECPLARTTALRAAVAIESHRMRLSSGARYSLQGPPLGQLLTGLADCLEIDGKFATLAAVQSALTTLMDLMVAVTQSAPEGPSQLLEVIKSLKLVRVIVETLRCDLLVCMRLRCLERVGVSSIAPGSIDIWGTSVVRDTEADSTFVALRGGWGERWDHATVQTDAPVFFDLQEAACRILQLTQDIDEELMEQCGKHTVLLSSLIASLGGAPRLDKEKNMSVQTAALTPSLRILLTAHENIQYSSRQPVPDSPSSFALKPYEVGMLHKAGLIASKAAISRRWLFSKSHLAFAAATDLLSAYIARGEAKAAQSSSAPAVMDGFLNSKRGTAALAPLHVLTSLAYRINGIGNIIEHIASTGRENFEDDDDDDDNAGPQEASRIGRDDASEEEAAMLLSSTFLAGSGPTPPLMPALKLINLLISNTSWRAGLGLGGPFEGPSIGPEATFALSSLVHLKTAFDSAAAWLQSVRSAHNSRQSFIVPVKSGCVSVSVLNQAEMLFRATSSQAGVALALMLQHSYEARQLIARGLDVTDPENEEEGDYEDGTTPEEGKLREEGPLLLMSCIRTVNDSVNFLRAPCDPPSSSGSSSSSNKERIKKDLAALKSKTRLSETSTPSDAVAPKSPMQVQPEANTKKKISFSSSFASPTARPVKLQQQSRSYTWKQPTPKAPKSATTVAGGSKRLKATSITQASQTATPIASAIEMPEEHRLSMWSSMLLLQSAFANSEKAQNLAADFGLQDTLNHFIRLIGYWGSIASQRQNRVTSCGEAWVPSEGHLAAAVLGLCSAFIQDNVHTKQKLIAAGESLAALHCATTPGTAAGSTLHQLLSLGLSRSIHPPFRWLCFELTESLASVENKLTLSQTANSTNKLTAQKVALAHVLNIAIQRTLHSSSGPKQSTDPQAIAHMLDAYTACLCSTASATPTSVRTMKYLTSGGTSTAGSVMGSSVAKGYSVGAGPPSALLSLLNGGDAGGNHGPGGAGGAPEFNTIPVPELLAWVWDYHLKLGSSDDKETLAHKEAIAAAVLRCLGRMAAPLTTASDSENDYNNNLENEPEDIGITGVSVSRRLIANAMSEQALRIYVEALDTYGNDQRNMVQGASTGGNSVSAITAAALCTLLLHSEQARALIRNRIDDRHRKLLLAAAYNPPAIQVDGDVFKEVAKAASEVLTELL